MENSFFIPQTAFLSNVVHSIWQVDGAPGFKTETILPKGIVEIIFNFSDYSTIQTKLGERQYQLQRCFIWGFNTLPVQLQLPTHLTFFGMRFHPTAIRYVFGVPAGEFANQAVDLTLIDTALNSLWHQLIEEKTFAERISIVSAWLSQKLCDILGQEKLLDFFLCGLNQRVPTATELAKQFCYSPRHVSRKLKSLTGMNMEEILRYKKYLNSVYLIHETNLPLTDIAYTCQFSDQSHFINTFKSLALMTPGEYRNLRGSLQGHIYENVR